MYTLAEPIHNGVDVTDEYFSETLRRRIHFSQTLFHAVMENVRRRAVKHRCSDKSERGGSRGPIALSNEYLVGITHKSGSRIFDRGIRRLYCKAHGNQAKGLRVP